MTDAAHHLQASHRRGGRACAAALALALLTGGDGASLAVADTRAETRVATGAIEAEVRLPQRPASRTADRYVSATGEPREIQDVPVVAYLAGRVATASPPRPTALELAQRGESFRPSLLVVPVGARVTFPNGDNLFHNVFSYSRHKRFDLGRYPRGESKSVTFEKPGYVKVLCEVHKWMRAAVLVLDHPYYALVPESGRFRIEDVPAGSYTLVVETFERRMEAPVTVSGDGTARVTIVP